MKGLGTLVNVATIVIGSSIGIFLGRGIPEKYRETIMSGLALAVGLIGLQMSLKTENILIVILSIVIGSIIGEYWHIEDKLNNLGAWLGDHLGKKKAQGQAGGAAKEHFVEGFVTTSLIFCVGAMAIIGSLQDGLSGDPSTLYAKSMLDFVSSTIFGATYGLGVTVSALSVGVYQGLLTLLAGFVGPYLTERVITEITATGGLTIVAMTLNMLNLGKIRIGNMLPAIFLAGVFAVILG